MEYSFITFNEIKVYYESIHRNMNENNNRFMNRNNFISMKSNIHSSMNERIHFILNELHNHHRIHQR